MNNRFLCSITVGLIVLGLSGADTVKAAEKKALEDIDIDALTNETQKTIGSDNDAFNLVWVIPSEFWHASLSQDDTLPADERRLILNVLDKYMIIGIVRADISALGTFRFHNDKSVFDSLHVDYVADSGKRHSLKLQRRGDDDAQVVIDAMKPLLRAAMGQMGANFHLYVCHNSVGRDGTRISPYDSGTVAVTLDQVGDNSGGTTELAFPLDSLYVPRKCAQCAQHAHISWKFCPWCGTKHTE